MICTRCGQPVEWWPLGNRWGSIISDNDTTTAWTFICPARTPTDPYHHIDETAIY
jgi:hypothetical protein